MNTCFNVKIPRLNTVGDNTSYRNIVKFLRRHYPHQVKGRSRTSSQQKAPLFSLLRQYRTKYKIWSLCGIALILYHRFSKKSSVILPRFFKVLHRHVFRQPYAVFRQIKHISVPCHLSAPYTVYERLAVSHTNLRCGFGIS